jgi:hypothetical protein
MMVCSLRRFALLLAQFQLVRSDVNQICIALCSPARAATTIERPFSGF